MGKEVGWGENRGARRLLRCFMNTSWIMCFFCCRKGWGEVEQEEGRRLYEDAGLGMARLVVELLKIVPQVSETTNLGSSVLILL